MKRNVVFLLVVITALLALMAGCQGGKKSYVGRILPSRIENIPNEDVITEGAEGIEERQFDVTAFHPRMFIGTWCLQNVQGTAADLVVPAPSGSGMDTWAVGAFPLDIVFGSPERAEEQIPFDDFTYMEATYELADYGVKSGRSDSGIAAAQAAEEMCFRMMYEVIDTTLGVGFTGEVTDERYYNEVVDSVDVFEVDYDFSWSGYELTLKYGGASATYVPATYKGNMQSAVKGFYGANGQSKIPGWSFSPLSMNGDGSGMVSTYYDTNIPMKYEFSEDGKFTVVTEHGEEYSYDRYWYSDTCLTLPAGDMKMMYQNGNYLVWNKKDTYLQKIVWPVEETMFVNQLTIAGKKMGNILWKSVSELIKSGYQTNVDVNLSRIPSGSISPEFELAFRTAHLKVRAINPTDLEIPLGACIVCWYQYDEDSGSVVRKLNYMFSDDIAVCGETTRAEVKEYANLYSIDDNTMIVSSTSIGNLDDYDFSDYSARVLDGMNGENATAMLVFEMKGDMLHAITVYIADFFTGNLEHNMEYGKLSDISAASMRENVRRRDTIAENVVKMFSSEDSVTCDTYGTVFIPWPKIFEYGKAELSDAGKERIDEVIETYKGALQEYDNISAIEVGVYAGTDLIENGQSFTVARADALLEYLNSETSRSRRRDARLYGTEITSVGYGSADYLGGKKSVNNVSVRFLMIPESTLGSKDDVSLVLKSPEGKESYDYMKLREEEVGRKMAAFAQKYAGEITHDHYVNKAVGMDWTLPEGWHFFSDDEMIALNGGSAKELLQDDRPAYVFAAINDSYDRMIDLCLYANEDEMYEEATSEFAESLYNSYKSYCETSYSDVKAESEDVTIGGRTVKKGTFRFSTDEQTFVRKQYYLVFEDACCVITLSGTEDSEVLDDPGITESAGGSSRIKIIDKKSLGLDEEETVEYGVPGHIDIYQKRPKPHLR